MGQTLGSSFGSMDFSNKNTTIGLVCLQFFKTVFCFVESKIKELEE